MHKCLLMVFLLFPTLAEAALKPSKRLVVALFGIGAAHYGHYQYTYRKYIDETRLESIRYSHLKKQSFPMPRIEGSPLLHGAKAGDLWLIKQEIKRNPPSNRELNKALIAAIVNDKAGIVHFLLMQGANANTETKSLDREYYECRQPPNRTVLMLAAQRGNLAIASLLLASGADVGAITEYQHGTTALHYAYASENPKIVKLLHEHKEKQQRIKLQSSANDITHSNEDVIG